MKATFNNSYPKRAKNGNMVDVFVYHVTGTTQELADYKAVRGDQYREDSATGAPLFFSLNYVGETVDLMITTNGNVVADTSNLRKANNLVQQYDFLKEQLAAQLLSQIGFGNIKRNVTSSVGQQQTENQEIDPFKG
jgi:hypothetical protein